jgi:hypothetical protein
MVQPLKHVEDLLIHPDASPVAKIDLDQSPGPPAPAASAYHPRTVTSPPVSTAAVTCTGAKYGPTFSTIRASSPSEHHAPLRRATSVTFALGASVSSTIRTLSSCDRRRRRSTTPKTTTRTA